MPASVCTAIFDTIHPHSCDVLSSLIRKLNKTTCMNLNLDFSSHPRECLYARRGTHSFSIRPASQ